MSTYLQEEGSEFLWAHPELVRTRGMVLILLMAEEKWILPEQDIGDQKILPEKRNTNS